MILLSRPNNKHPRPSTMTTSFTRVVPLSMAISESDPNLCEPPPLQVNDCASHHQCDSARHPLCNYVSHHLRRTSTSTHSIFNLWLFCLDVEIMLWSWFLSFTTMCLFYFLVLWMFYYCFIFLCCCSIWDYFFIFCLSQISESGVGVLLHNLLLCTSLCGSM